MRIGIYTDVHYCSNSSIIRSRGEKFSTRIENCIRSVNWAEDLFKQNNCDAVICLGDFFDRNNLTAEEIRGLNDIKFFSDVSHYFLVGNHEISKYDCTTSSMHLFNSYPFIKVVDTPEVMFVGDTQLCFLPYTIEEERKSINELWGSDFKKRIVLSHNDIKGIRYGAFLSEEGLDLDDIKSGCNLFLNGHLHNGKFIDDEEKMLNLGNLTGQNFGEDANKYKHLVCIVDTDTMAMDFFENPYAFNFVKIDVTDNSEITDDYWLPNSVVSLKCKESMISVYKESLNNKNVIASRVIIEPDDISSFASNDDANNLHVDHLKLFEEFVVEKLGSLQEVKDELTKIMMVEDDSNEAAV